MLIYDTVTLVADDPNAHGIFAEHTRTERTVFATIRSVSMSEAYEARAQGLTPEFRVRLEKAFEYQGERSLIFRGVEYDVIRTYKAELDGIELTCARTVHETEGA